MIPCKMAHAVKSEKGKEIILNHIPLTSPGFFFVCFFFSAGHMQARRSVLGKRVTDETGRDATKCTRKPPICSSETKRGDESRFLLKKQNNKHPESSCRRFGRALTCPWVEKGKFENDEGNRAARTASSPSRVLVFTDGRTKWRRDMKNDTADNLNTQSRWQNFRERSTARAAWRVRKKKITFSADRRLNRCVSIEISKFRQSITTNSAEIIPLGANRLVAKRRFVRTWRLKLARKLLKSRGCQPKPDLLGHLTHLGEKNGDKSSKKNRNRKCACFYSSGVSKHFAAWRRRQENPRRRRRQKQLISHF